jgi:serine/threonine protein kinase
LFRLDLTSDHAERFVAHLDALVAADLSHAAIATPIAAGFADTLPYLALDFVTAEPLDIYARDAGVVPSADIVRLVGQLAAGLDFAAEHGQCHGALHPRDVLVSADDVRVTGLGIAQALADIGVTLPARRPYTAPERTSEARVERTADVYSVGVLVYELLAGRRLSGASEQAVQTLEIGDGHVSGVREALRRALADDPGDRYDTVSAFVEDLRIALHGASSLTRASRRRRKTGDTPVASALSSMALELPLLAAFSEPEPDSEREFTRDEAPVPVARLEPEPVTAPEPLLTIAANDDHDRDEPMNERDEFERESNDLFADVSVEPVETATMPSADRFTSGQTGDRSEPPPIRHESAFEQTRSALWPIFLAVVIGVALGSFVTAMVMLGRDTGTDGAAPKAAESQTAPIVVDEPPVVPPREPERAVAPPARPVAAAPARPSAPVTSSLPATPAGRLLVRSTPSGARVTVNGKDAGVTPVTIRDLANGTHTVRITRDGYLAVERRVSLAGARPSQRMTVTLTRVPTPSTAPAASARSATSATSAASDEGGSLYVNSLPAGANVFVDGKLIGQAPFMMPGLAQGEHTVHMELEGYQRWASSVRIVAGKVSRVSGSLEK